MTASILPLHARDVGYRVGDQDLLDGISFELGRGPLTVVMGPNGAGKSLLLRLCHGLLDPTAGSLDYAVRWSDARRKQAFVFQRPVLLRRSAAANVEFALAQRGLDRRDRRRRAADALRRVGLERIATRDARVLSGGEQQRLAIARAWALEPEVLFLDEPTASLDPAAIQAIEQTIRAVHAGGTKVIWTTHDLAQARRLADELLFLSRGRLVEKSPAADFPSTGEARAFVDGKLGW